MARSHDDPAREVLHSPGRPSLTASGLVAQVDSLVAQLGGLGLATGARVAVVLPDGPELATTLLATMAVGACAPLNTGLTADEVAGVLRDVGAEVLLVAESGHRAAEQAAAEAGCPVVHVVAGDRAGTCRLAEPGGALVATAAAPAPGVDDDLALLLHTSGTTSRPKLVGLRQRQLLGSAGEVAGALALGPGDRSLLVMPLFHVHGIVAGLLAPLLGGGDVVVPSGHSTADLGRLVEESEPTWLTAVPTMLQALLDQVRARPFPHRLRVIRSCSSALPGPVATGLEESFGVPVLEAYGMTEGAHQIASNPLPPAARKLGSVGLPTGPDVAVVDREGRPLPAGQVGEVVLRGGSVIDAYLSPPEANETAFRDGWFASGDLGLLDDDGYLFLTGRSKELINRAGENISPREVEDVLAEHPSVATVVVFGVPDERLGEQVAAAVVLREGAAPSERELRMFVAERLAGFKVPRRIVACDSIPKGPTGKLQRRGLAEQLGLADLDGTPAPVPPRHPDGPLEETLAELWAEVLRRPITDANARFLEVGGDSLAAARLLTRVNHELDVDVTMIELFDAPTIAAQAELLEPLLLEG